MGRKPSRERRLWMMYGRVSVETSGRNQCTGYAIRMLCFNSMSALSIYSCTESNEGHQDTLRFFTLSHIGICDVMMLLSTLLSIYEKYEYSKGGRIFFSESTQQTTVPGKLRSFVYGHRDECRTTAKYDSVWYRKGLFMPRCMTSKLAVMHRGMSTPFHDQTGSIEGGDWGNDGRGEVSGIGNDDGNSLWF